MLVIQRNRRAFFRAAGVSLALPTLEAISRPARAAEGDGETGAPMRMVCIGNEFGMYPGAFWPQGAGRDYELSPLLEPLAEHKQNLTVFSHLDHGLKGGHFAVHTFLTGVNAADARTMTEGGVSLDQRAAEFVGSRTRYPSLTIGSEDGLHGGPMMSWTRTGTRVPPMAGPVELFRALFHDEPQSQKLKAAGRIDLHASILDGVLEDAKSLRRRISKVDREKLEEYFASVRDVESKLALDRQWQKVPRPTAPIDEPENEGLTKDLPKIYDLIALALQTDSSRVATVEVGGSFAASDLGIKKGYHGLSHHGMVQESIDLLVQIEKYQVEQYSRFLSKLSSIQEPNCDGSLLDRTMVLFGSGMGNANSHTNNDLPVILAGGGFRHGELKVYPEHGRKRVPLCNLFVSMLQRFGVEVDQFSTGQSTLTGLEVA